MKEGEPMNPLSRLFKRASPVNSPGVVLEMQGGLTAFSGTAYSNATFRAAVDAIARHAQS